MTWIELQIYNAELDLAAIRHKAATPLSPGQIELVRDRVRRLSRWIDDLSAYVRFGRVTVP